MRSVPLVALAIACGAHAAAIGALRAVRVTSLRALVEPAASEIDLDTREASELLGALDRRAIGPEATPEAAAAMGSRGGLVAVETQPLAMAERAGGAGTDDHAEPLEPGPGGWSFSPTALQIDLRAAVTPDLVAAGGETPSDREPRKSTGSTTGGVAEGLAAHDVDVGMGRGGSILSAAESAARSNDAPLDGGATFDVIVRADGVVQARVSRAERDLEGWARVAASLARTVDPRGVRMPPGARGWHVVVRVDAKVQFADGRDVRSLHGPRLSLAPSVLQAAIEGNADAGVSSTGPGGPDHVSGDPSDTPPVGGALGRGPSSSGAGGGIAQGIVQRVLPMPTLAMSGKICSGALTVSPMGIGLGGSCSFENIGTGTARVVSGRIVSEEPL